MNECNRVCYVSESAKQREVQKLKWHTSLTLRRLNNEIPERASTQANDSKGD